MYRIMCINQVQILKNTLRHFNYLPFQKLENKSQRPKPPKLSNTPVTILLKDEETSNKTIAQKLNNDATTGHDVEIPITPTNQSYKLADTAQNGDSDTQEKINNTVNFKIRK